MTLADAGVSDRDHSASGNWCATMTRVLSTCPGLPVPRQFSSTCARSRGFPLRDDRFGDGRQVCDAAAAYDTDGHRVGVRRAELEFDPPGIVGRLDVLPTLQCWDTVDGRRREDSCWRLPRDLPVVFGDLLLGERRRIGSVLPWHEGDLNAMAVRQRHLGHVVKIGR